VRYQAKTSQSYRSPNCAAPSFQSIWINPWPNQHLFRKCRGAAKAPTQIL
jgi:hypothetical protein